MDASNRLSFLVGHLRVPLNETTAEEWLGVVREFAYMAKPHFNNLRTMPMRDYFNGWRERNHWIAPPSVLPSKDPELFKKRCLELSISDESAVFNLRHYRGLLLLEDMNFILWKGEYFLEFVDGKNPYTKHTAVSCSLSKLDDAALLHYFETKGRGYNIMDHLHVKFFGLITDREKKLAAIKAVDAFTVSVTGRVSLSA